MVAAMIVGLKESSRASPAIDSSSSNDTGLFYPK